MVSSSWRGVNVSEPDNLIRKTYYLTDLLVKAIALKAAHEDVDKSEIVRNALEGYIEKEYIDKATSILKGE